MRFLLLFVFFLFGYWVLAQDKLNQVDRNGLKQGHWIYYGKDRPESGITLEGKVEEGSYINDRKEGIWIKYHQDGQTIKLIGNYVNNRPCGIYKKYHENGVLKERGFFEKNLFKDTLFRFANTGDTTEVIVFDQLGKVVDTVCFSPVINQPIVCSYPSTKTITIKNYRPNGKNKIYNEDKQLIQEGLFKDGKLWDGKVYVYDRDGILLRVEIYKSGVYHSDGKL